MPNFTAGTSFSDGVTNDVTAAKLNALVADAVPTSSLSLNSTTGTISLFSSGTGTAATPAIQPTGDANTGIFFPAADTIAFSEGGAESMRINSSGQVGIGTTSPNSKLFVGVGSSPNAAQLLVGYLDGSENYYDANTHYFRNGSASEVMRINSGKVGIGTTSADSIFHIKDSVAVLTIEGTATSSASVQFKTNTINRYKIATPDSSADLAFYSSGTTERLRIDSSGNVGIGTTSPSSYGLANTSKFVVTGSSRADTWVVGGTSTGAYTFFSNNAQTAPTNAFQIGQGYSSGSDNAGFLLVKAASPLIFGTSDAEQMRINSSGNCSIGTATALSKLHIHGDLTLSNATTAVTASTSTITPPATVAGYLTVSINGTSRKIPYYAT